MTIEHTRVPQNLEGMTFHPIKEYNVGSWCPLPDGKGPATQVHFMLGVPGLKHPIILRIKSRRAAEELIEALTFHMNDVWPARDEGG